MVEHYYFYCQTWITLANCYSLNKDHNTAIKLLMRVKQMEPRNCYALVLIGHEWSCIEGYDRAKQYYKSVLKWQPKNIRALWGLGNLFLKTEKFHTAIDYFKNAVKINNSCSTLYTQLAMACMNLNRDNEAFKFVLKREQIDPKDFFNVYVKAEILFKLGQYEQALQECNYLNEFIKNESRIYRLKAKIQEKLKMSNQAYQSRVQVQVLEHKTPKQLKNKPKNI